MSQHTDDFTEREQEVIAEARMGGHYGMKGLAVDIERECGITINVGTEGHCDWITICPTGYEQWFKALSEPIPDLMCDSIGEIFTYKQEDECKGNFNKVTKGSRHCYPHWHKGKY